MGAELGGCRGVTQDPGRAAPPLPPGGAEVDLTPNFPRQGPFQIGVVLIGSLCKSLLRSSNPHALTQCSPDAPDTTGVSREILFLLIHTFNERKPKHRRNLDQTPALRDLWNEAGQVFLMQEHFILLGTRIFKAVAHDLK